MAAGQGEDEADAVSLQHLRHQLAPVAGAPGVRLRAQEDARLENRADITQNRPGSAPFRPYLVEEPVEEPQAIRRHQQRRGRGRQQHGANAAEEGEQSHGDAGEGTGADGDVPKLSPAPPGGGAPNGNSPGAGDREEFRRQDGDG